MLQYSIKSLLWKNEIFNERNSLVKLKKLYI